MRDKIVYFAGAAAIVIFARDIYVAAGLPEEASQGIIFKIIFFHVPLAIASGT